MNKVEFLLNSETRKNFDKAVASFASTNTPKVNEAYKNTHWPKKIGFQFPEFVHQIINYYLEYCVLNNTYYTNNQEKTYLGDPFFKFIFMKYNKTIVTDYGLRDHIWSIVSACMSIGSKTTEYNMFWNPVNYLNETEKKQLVEAVEKGGATGKSNIAILAAIGAGLFVLSQG